MAKADLKFRYLEVDPKKINRAARLVPIAFSSEFPALQRNTDPNESTEAAGLTYGQVYIEVLDHGEGNVDLSMLNNRGAFLDEHDEKDQIGVIEKADLDPSERVTRGVVKMDTHEKAETRLGQMESNSRPHVSAGYKYTKFIRSEKLPNGRTAYRFGIKVFEVSSVAVPADPTIGVARNYQDLPAVDSPEIVDVDSVAKKLTPEQRNQMKRSLLLLDPAPALDTKGGGIDENKIRSEERVKVQGETEKLERSRAKEIMLACDEFIKDHGNKNAGKLGEQLRALAGECLYGANPVSIGEFQTRAMREVIKATPAKPVLIEDVADEDGQKDYSLLRGVQNALKQRMAGKEAIPDGLEGEVHQEMVRRAKADFGGLGYDAAGFQVPSNARLRMGKVSRGERGRMQRDMQATVFNAGGAFVPTQLVVPIIELLRNRMILETLGVRTMAGLQGNIVIPRAEAAATAYSVTEIGALTASQQILGQIALSPKRVGATQNYSKQFVMQSTPDAESFMRDEFFTVIAMNWDRLGLNGQGAASEPLGVFNTPGIGSVIFGTTPTYAKIVDFETLVGAANADSDNMHYITTPTAKGALKKVAAALTGATTIGGTQNALWVGKGRDGEMNGYPAHATNQVPNNQLAFGDWSQCIRALWGGLDVVVDYFTKAVNAEVAITINTWGDFAVRHPQAFVVSADAANL